MKRSILISALAIAAMAALSLSCEREGGDMAPKTREVSFDLSLNNPETKFSMTEETGYLKAAWEVGDKVTVMWGVGGSYKGAEEFEVTAINDGGRTATFTNASSAMPSDCIIGVYYPSRPIDGVVYSFSLDAFSPAVDNSWDLAHTGENLVYGASGITVSGGIIPSINLEQKSSFLYIKGGTAVSGLSNRFVIKRNGLHYQFRGRYDSCEMSSYTYTNSCTISSTTAGEIPYDIYIPFIADGTEQTPTIELKQGDVTIVRKTYSEKALQPGKVYDISSSLFE